MTRFGHERIATTRRGRRPAGVGASRVGAAIVWFAVASACAATRGGVAVVLEPRYVAVHNALAAMGLAQVGPLHEGVLAEGREARVALDLARGCSTVAVVAGEGVRDIDAQLLDSSGRPLAHDTTSEPQAVLRACMEAPDSGVLVLKAASGGGAWVAGLWQGGVSGEPSGPGQPPTGAQAHEANGTCEAPIPLAAGTVTGSTTRGEQRNAGTCEQSDSRELVYQLDVAQRARVVIEVEARFDSVLYVRKDDCGDPNAEIDCSDDAPDRTHSRIERVFEPGRYFVFVDGYSHDAGSFKMTVTMTDVLAVSEVCRRAGLLALGTPGDGTTAAMANDATASCGGGAEGADSPWRIDLPTRSRLRIVEHSEDVTPVVHLRRSCTDEQSEVACGDSGSSAGDAVLVGVFDSGEYTAFADAHDRDAAGRYSLRADVQPPSGSGVGGDGCGDAALLGTGANVAGDTFAARDDVAGSCGGLGAPDVVYRLDVTRRSRFVATLQAEESPHLLIAWRRCGDRSAEVACGRDIDEVLSPDTYFVAVDGRSEQSFGRFSLAWSLQDLSGQGAACAAAPLLANGSTVTGSTAGAGDKFAASCAGSDGATSGPDRIYRFVLSKRSRVRVVVTATSFNAVLALRKSCADASGGPRASEVVCESDSDVGQRTAIERTLEAGTYWVVVDGQTPNDQGAFAIEYRVMR